MSIAVNPVGSASSVTPIGTGSAAYANSISAYEQFLRLQSENQLDANTQVGANDNTLLSADLLDLSPAALNLLNGIGETTDTTGILATTQTNASVQLTPAQQQQVTAIVAQFAGQPLTQQTFAQIQNALTAAGINPEQLSLQQLLAGYNYAYTPGFAFNEQLFTDTLTA